LFAGGSGWKCDRVATNVRSLTFRLWAGRRWENVWRDCHLNAKVAAVITYGVLQEIPRTTSKHMENNIMPL